MVSGPHHSLDLNQKSYRRHKHAGQKELLLVAQLLDWTSELISVFFTKQQAVPLGRACHSA